MKKQAINTAAYKAAVAPGYPDKILQITIEVVDGDEALQIISGPSLRALF